jgi:formate hydrogenlyase subunit 4
MLGVLVEPILLLGLWVAAQVAGSTHISFITDTLYHWPGGAQHSADSGAVRLRLRHLYRDGQTAVRSGGSGAGAAGRAASEYSGSGFGVLKWGISLKQLVVLQMFVGVFSRGAR